MKKLLIVLAILLFSVTGLFARTYFGSVSVGYSYYYSTNETIKFSNPDHEEQSSQETSQSINIDANAYYWFPFDTELGLNVGMNVLVPLRVLGTNEGGIKSGGLMQSSYCIWAPKIGVSVKVGDRFRSVSSFGYEMMLYGSWVAANEQEESSKKSVPATILNHGIYLDESFSYSFTENVGMEFGAEMFLPIAGHVWCEAGDSQMSKEELSVRYSGVMFSPHLGVSISW